VTFASNAGLLSLRLPARLVRLEARCTWDRAEGSIPSAAIPSMAATVVPCQRLSCGATGVHVDSSASRVTGIPASECPWQARMRAVKFSRRHNIKLVEDCSQAYGASTSGKDVGTQADVAAFSLQGRRLVAAGERGRFVTSDVTRHGCYGCRRRASWAAASS
jgi:hypothetical protein